VIIRSGSVRVVDLVVLNFGISGVGVWIKSLTQSQELRNPDTQNYETILTIRSWEAQGHRSEEKKL